MTLVMAPRCHAEKVLLGHHDNDNFLVTLAAVPHGRWALGRASAGPISGYVTSQHCNSQPRTSPLPDQSPHPSPPLAGPILHLASLRFAHLFFHELLSLGCINSKNICAFHQEEVLRLWHFQKSNVLTSLL